MTQEIINLTNFTQSTTALSIYSHLFVDNTSNINKDEPVTSNNTNSVDNNVAMIASISIASVLVLGAGGYTLYAYNYNLWPFIPKSIEICTSLLNINNLDAKMALITGDSMGSSLYMDELAIV